MNETTVLEIELTANDGTTATLKLDNPKDSVTYSDVTSAMTTAITNGFLLSTYGSVITGVGKATVITTTRKALTA